MILFFQASLMVTRNRTRKNRDLRLCPKNILESFVTGPSPSTMIFLIAVSNLNGSILTVNDPECTLIIHYKPIIYGRI